MIQNDQELAVTQERLRQFVHFVANLRVKADADEFPFVASGYIEEIKKMQAEILEYLQQPSGLPLPAKVA